jgi:outer membrane lipoprotein-sorting protein
MLRLNTPFLMKQAKKFLGILGIAGAAFVRSVAAQEDANNILERLRSTQVQELDQDFAGRLRMADGSTIPFRVRFNGAEILFKFSNPEETLRLRLKDEGSVLTEQTANGAQPVSGAKFTQSVRGTDISYEDLALRFIYWDRAKVEGEQRIGVFPCWIVLVQPSSRNTEYGSVRIWVPKGKSGLVQAEGFDSQSRLLKRFKVISGQEVNGKWILKQMRIERFDPETGKLASRTYLEIES